MINKIKLSNRIRGIEKHKKARCQNCDAYTELVSGNMCESCFTSKQEQISEYGANSEEVSW